MVDFGFFYKHTYISTNLIAVDLANVSTELTWVNALLRIHYIIQ